MNAWTLIPLSIFALVAVMVVIVAVARDGGRQSDALVANTNPTAAERACGRAILLDWTADGRVDRTYRQRCYGAALGLVPINLDLSTVYDDVTHAYHARSTG